MSFSLIVPYSDNLLDFCLLLTTEFFVIFFHAAVYVSLADQRHPPPDYSMAGHHTFDTAAAAAAVALDEADLGQLSLEIERERHEYLEKSKHLNEQLQTLKGEIDALKVDDKMTVLDILHKEQQEQGNTKYSTIQKVKRGSATSRVAFFEEL